MAAVATGWDCGRGNWNEDLRGMIEYLYTGGRVRWASNTRTDPVWRSGGVVAAFFGSTKIGI